MTHARPGSADVLIRPENRSVTGIARSMGEADRAVSSLRDFHAWFAAHLEAESSEIRRIPFTELKGWRFEEPHGNLVHESGKFFSVQGLRFRNASGAVPEWDQPIINQPEVGVLGILVKEFDGIPHCLMQAKMEPGNHNRVQISPTVQATRSNYTRVHGGRPVPYLDFFRNASRHQVLADVLQSEQGSWFYRKRNRNIIVATSDDVELLDGFYWLSVGQLHALLSVDDLVNMDSRSVMACFPLTSPSPSGPWAFDGAPAAPWPVEDASIGSALTRSLDPGYGALHSPGSVRNWFTGARAGFTGEAHLVDLGSVRNWQRSEDRISHGRGVFFDVMAVDVRTGSREVASWTQPMIEARGQGVAAFLVQRIGGVLHVLVRVGSEPGFMDAVELAPTVQCTPENYAVLPSEAAPPFLDEVLHAPADAVRFDTVLSEEGGRFFHTRSRYLIVELPAERELVEPDDFRWLAVHQLSDLVQHSNYLNIQARTLLACLHSLLGPAGGECT
ncbi:NDP-hexose 2,3-dehydratase family protein [Streptomyces sp. NRRL S-4]|uniref:NDP-hexose 2,3-dehydratase family protein n=1 Tax=Streptomyces sp. NRRL S-4 TaxID=1519471 RepID=UPI00099DC35E|nr:NDP-hexose 2,3-dehydratase family protein [Streptomyces sp. NRRL S-4]